MSKDITPSTFDKEKVYLDNCYLCNESKAAIKHSQSTGDPIICGMMSPSTESSSAEMMNENDHHVFVVTRGQMKADEQAELDYLEHLGDFVDFMENNPSKALGIETSNPKEQS